MRMIFGTHVQDWKPKNNLTNNQNRPKTKEGWQNYTQPDLDRNGWIQKTRLKDNHPVHKILFEISIPIINKNFILQTKLI